MCASLELHWFVKGSCRSSSENLIGLDYSNRLNHWCINVTHTTFSCKHLIRHP